jgi:hypothetical protein
VSHTRYGAGPEFNKKIMKTELAYWKEIRELFTRVGAFGMVDIFGIPAADNREEFAASGGRYYQSSALPGREFPGSYKPAEQEPDFSHFSEL